MFILVDDEDRENEWDIVIASEFCTPEKINFMSQYARGLICVSITQERADRLWFVPMCRENEDSFHTAFTISVDAKFGISTGISAFDRSKTIADIVDEKKTRSDFVSPWHMFPLVAKKGGVQERAGHTEASVELCRMAGLQPSWVICEIMNQDGTMARLPDLLVFAEKFGVKIGTIQDLLEYKISLTQ